MAQGVNALVALEEDLDLSSVPRSHIMAHNRL